MRYSHDANEVEQVHQQKSLTKLRVDKSINTSVSQNSEIEMKTKKLERQLNYTSIR